MVHHNPYESFPNTVVINGSKSSSEIQMGQSGSQIEHAGENSQYEIDFITNLHEGSYEDPNSRDSK